MKRLTTYINEAVTKTKVDVNWMREKYVEFNEKYFMDELPDVDDIILKFDTIKPKTWLGCFGFDKGVSYNRLMMKNNKYLMIYNKKIVTDIRTLHPTIILNKNFTMTIRMWESTLIHEMIHLYTYKDAYAPKQAHGPEFKQKCKTITVLAERLDNIHYDLDTYAQRNGEWETSETTRKYKKREQTDIVGIYIKTNYDTRFLFVKKSNLETIIASIKEWTKGLVAIYVSEDTYKKMCTKFGKFTVCRTYRYYNADKFKGTDKIMAKETYKLKDEDVNESWVRTKRNIKPEDLKNLVYVGPSVNLSEINVEDIVDGKITPQDDETDDDRLIDGEK